MKLKARKKKTSAPPAAHTRSLSPRGAIPQGRVQKDQAVFTWEFDSDDLSAIAKAMAKNIEVRYQMELLEHTNLF